MDLSDFILAATMNLDPAGAAAGVEGNRIFQQLQGWATHHALDIGLHPPLPDSPDGPAMPIALAGIHVAYRQAQDGQPRPEVVVQLSQRRRDLEDQNLDPKHRTVLLAGTTLIANVDGTVEYLVTKPLPLVDEVRDSLPPGHIALTHHEAGIRRLEAMQRWLGDLEDEDALSPWTLQPAAARVDFAAIHSPAEAPDRTEGRHRWPAP